MISEKTVLRIRNEVAFRKLSDGTITIVSPVTDKMISINSSAAEIWELINGSNSVVKIKNMFFSSHSGDLGIPSNEKVKDHVFEIIKMFFDKNLIEIINS